MENIKEIELKNGMTMSLKIPHFYYINYALRLNSYQRLSEIFCKSSKPTKEISESVGAYMNLKKVCGIDKINEINWLHIGDGTYPRTSALFSMLMKTEQISIDPELNIEFSNNWKQKNNVDNIEFNKMKFEDYNKYLANYGIVCMHAHIDLKKINEKFTCWKYILTSPCCMTSKQIFDDNYLKENNIKTVKEYDDYGIISHKRKIVIYESI